MSKHVNTIEPLERMERVITAVTLFIWIREVLIRIPTGTILTLIEDFRDFL
jgi:hypothetical protein